MVNMEFKKQVLEVKGQADHKMTVELDVKNFQRFGNYLTPPTLPHP